MWMAIADEITGEDGYGAVHLKRIRSSWTSQKKAALASIDNLEGVLIHNHVELAMRNHLLKNLRMYYEDPFHHLE